jgi:small-conductance mechanosensitive channel
MTHDRGSDPWSFAVRLADQVYNVLRLQAKMPHKPFIEVLTENGFIAGPPETGDAAVHGNATDGSNDNDQIQDRQEYDVNLHARLTFLEDRVKILEKREELLEGQLDRATQAMAALRSTNLEFAKKVSEVQQRNHELTRTYAV